MEELLRRNGQEVPRVKRVLEVNATHPILAQLLAFRTAHPGDGGATLPTPTPNVRLDYVFIPAAFADRLVHCEVVRHPEAVRASDHFPLLADLRL